MLLASASGWACQVPVFRYALERWEPGMYRVRAPGEVVIDWQANLKVEPSSDAGQLELYYPPRLGHATGAPIWSAPMSAENVRVMLDSPVRQELRKRLLAGESAVWLLLESGDAAKDEAAARTIEDGLLEAQEALELPDGVITQDEADDFTRLHENADVLQSDLPLKIAFSTMRLSREEAQESALIAILMHLERDLGEYINEPMVFPIFGRGRALEPLIGKGIRAANIMEAATYLCGACSCEIKEQNPGIDLLMTADWEPVASKEVVETVTFVGRDAAAERDDGRNLLAVTLVGGIIATLVNGWLLARWLSRRGKQS